MRDWNNNGKIDMEDDFITYHICRSMSNNQTNSPRVSWNDEVHPIVIVLLFAIIVLLAMA